MRLLYLYDDNILQDNYNNEYAYFPKPISFALHNALFKVTPANECLLFGELADNFIQVEKGALFLTFGMFAYLPTLPDPYAANLGILKEQFARENVAGVSDAYVNRNVQRIWLWFICEIKFKKETDDLEKVNVSFYFAPLQQQTQLYSSALNIANKIDSPDEIKSSQNILSDSAFLQQFNASQQVETSQTLAINPNTNQTFQTEMLLEELPDYQKMWDDNFAFFAKDTFALLDVSSHANQMGVSFGQYYDRNEPGVVNSDRLEMFKTYDVAATNQNNFPLQIEGMNVVAKNYDVKAFTVPQISWEPVINLSKLDPHEIRHCYSIIIQPMAALQGL
ncbi:MAG: hypothetical protein ACR2FN_03355 [Chitinophagaceae bacterium]